MLLSLLLFSGVGVRARACVCVVCVCGVSVCLSPALSVHPAAVAAAAATTTVAAGVQVASCDVKGKPRQFEREMLFSKVAKVSDVAKQLSEANKVPVPACVHIHLSILSIL